MNESFPKYRCTTETKKPHLVFVHEPGLETKVAFTDPDFWGFDPSLKEIRPNPEQWIERAQYEHQIAVATLHKLGIGTCHIIDMLREKPDEARKYIEGEFERVQTRMNPLSRLIQNSIFDAYESMREDPVQGVMLGLEIGKKFGKLPYETRRSVYQQLGTLMPQTSLYFMQDPVINTPNGLVKANMAMAVRKQEPDIVEIAIGKEHYIHRLRNRTEGGDITLASHAHGGDIGYKDGIMLFGINGQSGRNIVAEAEVISQKAGANQLVLFFTPDYFDQRFAYATGNVMHDDTIKMPVSDDDLLANSAMLKNTIVFDADGTRGNALEWTRKNFGRIIEVPDSEHLKWGSNVFPLGNKQVLSSLQLQETNRNLEKAGIEVLALPAETLTSGFGSWHCMIFYAR